MRYALVSDIHANLQAWTAVQADIRARNIDRIICLGDIIGYGPRPAEVLSSVYAVADYLVLGNHDAVVAGLLNSACFNDNARRMIEWTQAQLHSRATSFFQRVPLALAGEGFRCTHGQPAKPGTFSYVTTETDARQAWTACSEPLIFVGHSHQAGIMVCKTDGAFRQYPPLDFELEPQKRYLINVGSVGLPRDGDFRAIYSLFDTATHVVSFIRVPYDMDAFRQDVQEKGTANPQTDYLVRLFERKDLETVRPPLDFAPGRKSMKAGHPREADIRRLTATAARWRRLAAVALLALLLMIGGGIHFFLRAPRPLTRDGAPIAARILSKSKASLSLFPSHAFTVNQPPPGWRYELKDQRTQQISVSSNSLTISCIAPPMECRIFLPEIQTEKLKKLVFTFHFQTDQVVGDLPHLIYDYVYTDGSVEPGKGGKTPARLKNPGEYRIQYTISRIPRKLRAVRPRLEARCTGKIQFDRLQLFSH